MLRSPGAQRAPVLASSIASPGSPGTKMKALKADVASIKDSFDHFKDSFISEVQDAMCLAMNNEASLSGLKKHLENHSVAVRSSIRDIEFKVESLGEQFKEVARLSEEVSQESVTIREQLINMPQFQAISKRLKAIEAVVQDIKEAGGDADSAKKLRSISREKDSLEEQKDDLTERLRRAEKMKAKADAELSNQKDAFKALQRDFEQFQARQIEQHERRSKAAQKAWKERREGKRPERTPEENIEEFEEAIEPKAPSSSSSSSSSVPVMKVADPYAPGGALNRLGLGTGKAPKKIVVKKPKTEDSSSEEESEFEDKERDQVREAWRKKPKAKKDSDEE